MKKLKHYSGEYNLPVNKNILNWPIVTLRNSGEKERLLYDGLDRLVMQVTSERGIPYGDDDKVLFHLLVVKNMNNNNTLKFKSVREAMKICSLGNNTTRFLESILRLQSTFIVYKRWVKKENGKTEWVLRRFNIFSYVEIAEGEKYEYKFSVKFNDAFIENVGPSQKFFSLVNLEVFDNLSPLARKLYLHFLSFHRATTGNPIIRDIRSFADRLGIVNVYDRNIHDLKRQIDNACKEVRDKTGVKYECYFPKGDPIVLLGKGEN